LAGVENGVQCPLHRLVHGRRVLFVSQLQVTTLSAPNDASFNFGIRVKREAKTALPESFEAYLRAYNGGIPNGGSHEFGMLFSMQTNEMEASLLSTLHWSQPPGKENLLPIGRDGAMGLFLMSLNGADFGAIYSCFAWSDEAEGSLTYADDIHKVADCFSEMFRVKREYE
ncbi:SMI1/KNR4 family protein, partial [Prosthecobacter sp.]|uniref:SMI1/KNR4 family protein n=1 Tax=Prosthecobacter sp. TaxID=1965333 RepID=UPI00378503DA